MDKQKTKVHAWEETNEVYLAMMKRNTRNQSTNCNTKRPNLKEQFHSAYLEPPRANGGNNKFSIEHIDRAKDQISLMRQWDSQVIPFKLTER